MEKAAVKSKNHKILKHLTKALSFQNRPFTTRRDNWTEINTNRTKKHGNRGFSGPIVQIIPAEARRRSTRFMEEEEPTSPTVSCIGQIKCKKMMAKNREASSRKNIKKKTNPSMMEKLFGLGGGGGKRSGVAAAALPSTTVALGLSQMRKFASSRESLAKFDWETTGERHALSDDERPYSDGDDDVIIIPFSAPILGGGAAVLESQPRKEIDLWKRRTTAQPKPIKLNMEICVAVDTRQFSS